MTDHQILAVAHRTAWRYKISSRSAPQRPTYTFNCSTLLEFAALLLAAERAAVAAKALQRMADDAAQMGLTYDHP